MLHHVASRFCPCFGSLYEASVLAAGPPEAIKEQESKADADQFGTIEQGVNDLRVSESRSDKHADSESHPARRGGYIAQ